jgi:hypothetical protein
MYAYPYFALGVAIMAVAFFLQLIYKANFLWLIITGIIILLFGFIWPLIKQNL